MNEHKDPQNMPTDKPPSKQEKAIHEYLESLLFEVPDDNEESTSANMKSAPQVIDSPPAPVKEPEPAKPVIGLEQLVAEIPDVITDTVTQVVSEVALEVKTEVEQQLQTEIAPETIADDESGVPHWAQSRFQCLLFKVSGLSLAVPLVKLNSVIPWQDNITVTPNKTDWYLGLIQHLENQIKVIDTALLVMPENRRDNIDADPNNRFKNILLVDDYKWGLACDCIGDVIWLNKDDVKWRKNKTSRAWLSGTSLEHLCAIMDTEIFAQMLSETE